MTWAPALNEPNFNPLLTDARVWLYDGLVRFDEHGLPRADIAEGWGVTPDGTVYNFTIRANALWHDGTAVTSDDVLFTIEMMKSAGSLYPQDIKDLWDKIEVTRLNEKTLKLTLPEPYVPFIDYLTFGVLPMAERELRLSNEHKELGRFAPVEIDAIEKLMAEQGIAQKSRVTTTSTMTGTTPGTSSISSSSIATN